MPRIHFNPDGRRSPTEFEPVTVHHRKPPLDGVISSHRHNWSQLTCPIKGNMRVTTERQVWTVTSFRAVWIPPGVEHELTMIGATEFHAVFIDPRHSPLPANQCCVVDVSPLMRELMQWLGADYGPATDHSRRLTDVLLEEVRRANQRTSALVLPGDRRLKTLCEALMEDPGSTLTLGEWANVTGASERTLARLFQTELGTTFGAWRQQVRLSCAVDLLRSGISLSRIAADLGYADSAAFSTMFKRAFGVAPSRYHESSLQAMN